MIDSSSADSGDVDGFSIMVKPFIEDVLTRDTAVLLECDTGLSNLLNWSPRVINQNRFIKQHMWDGDYTILREALDKFPNLVSMTSDQPPHFARNEAQVTSNDSGMSVHKSQSSRSKKSSTSSSRNEKFFLRMKQYNANSSETDKTGLVQYRSFIVTVRSSIRTTDFSGNTKATNCDLDGAGKSLEKNEGVATTGEDSGCVVSSNHSSHQNIDTDCQKTSTSSSESKTERLFGPYEASTKSFSPLTCGDYADDEQVYLCLVGLRPAYSTEYCCPPLINRFVTQHGLGGKLVMLSYPKKPFSICALASLLGWLPQDLCGSRVVNLTDLVHKDDWAELYGPLKDAIRSPIGTRYWIPSLRWRCANGSTCLVQSFVRRRKQFPTEQKNTNSIKDDTSQDPQMKTPYMDYLEMLHEVVQGPKMLFNFFAPPNNDQFQMLEGFINEEMTEDFEKKIASGERPLRISEYWYARLMILCKELARPPMLQSSRATGLINYYASEGEEDENEVEEVNSSPGMPTPTTLQFGATEKEHSNSKKFNKIKHSELEAANNYRYVYGESRNSRNFQRDLRNMMIPNAGGNLLKFSPLKTSVNRTSQFLEWQQMDRIHRYLASIEDAKRKKQMPKVLISPKVVGSKMDLDATSFTYPDENCSQGSTRDYLKRYIYGKRSQLWAMNQDGAIKRPRVQVAQKKARLSGKKIELNSRNLAKHQQYCQERHLKRFAELCQVKSGPSMRQKSECLLAREIVDMKDRKSTSSSETNKNLLKKTKQVLSKKRDAYSQKICISILLMMEEVISEMLKRNVLDAITPPFKETCLPDISREMQLQMRQGNSRLRRRRRIVNYQKHGCKCGSR